jgi:hypothetical protein
LTLSVLQKESLEKRLKECKQQFMKVTALIAAESSTPQDSS